MIDSIQPGSPARRHRYALAMFAVIAPLYFIWGWNEQIGILGSDGPAYLVMARHYSGEAAAGSATALAGTFSRFPPLYAMVLAGLHATQDLVLAHAVTTALLLLGLAAMYCWLYLESGWAAGAALLTLLFAMLPGTWLLALSLQSEFLYLLLSCTALACLCAYPSRRRDEILYMAAFATAAAILTRAIGTALLLPLAMVGWSAPARTRIVSGAMIAAPLLLWHLLHRSGVSYTESFGGYYKEGTWNLLSRQVETELPALREALHGSIAQGGRLRSLVDLAGLVCVAGAAYRAARGRPDAVYLALYLSVILVWPFDVYDAQRFLWPVFGVFLAQPMLALLHWRWHRAGHGLSQGFLSTLSALLLVLALPGIALASERFRSAADSGIVGARSIRYWYDTDPARAERKTAGEAMAIAMLQDLGKEVPSADCVISIRPDLINYFADRLSGVPPDDSVADADFERKLHRLHCNYVFMTTARYTGYEQPLHPLHRLTEKVSMVDYRELPPEAPGDGPIVCMLVKFQQR